MKTKYLLDNLQSRLSSSPWESSPKLFTQKFRVFRAEVFQSIFTEVPSLEEFSVKLVKSRRVSVTINNIEGSFGDPSSDNYKSWLIEANLKSPEAELVERCLNFLCEPGYWQDLTYQVTRQQLKEKGILK